MSRTISNGNGFGTISNNNVAKGQGFGLTKFEVQQPEVPQQPPVVDTVFNNETLSCTAAADVFTLNANSGLANVLVGFDGWAGDRLDISSSTLKGNTMAKKKQTATTETVAALAASAAGLTTVTVADYGLPLGMKPKHLKKLALVEVKFKDQLSPVDVLITKVEQDDVDVLQSNPNTGREVGLEGLILDTLQELRFTQKQITCLLAKSKAVGRNIADTTPLR